MAAGRPAENTRLTSHRQSEFVKKPETLTRPKYAAQTGSENALDAAEQQIAVTAGRSARVSFGQLSSQ